MTILSMPAILCLFVVQAAPPLGDPYDVVLLAPRGPLLLRIWAARSGQPLSQARTRFIDQLIVDLDKDRDGKIIRREFVASPFVSSGGQAPGNSSFFDVYRNMQVVSRQTIVDTIDQVAGKALHFRERDGGVQHDRALWRILDKDSSGDLDAGELAAAPKLLAAQDLDKDECITLVELESTETSNINEQELLNRYRDTSQNMTRETQRLQGVQETRLVRDMLNSYDKNSDGVWDAKELGWDEKFLALLDINRDHKIDSGEWTKVTGLTPHLELAVTVGTLPVNTPPCRLIAHQGEKIAAAFPAVAKLRFLHCTVSMDGSAGDNVLISLERAKTAFTNSDRDQNGYVDIQESGQRQPLNGFHAVIDADRDGKVFWPELEHYVRMREEPGASCCQLTLHDEGHGFYRAMDHNSDGKLSLREVKLAAESLRRLDRADPKVLSATEPMVDFRLEFGPRAPIVMFPNFNYFVPVAATPTPSTKARSRPLWFQRMDRNEDGEISLGEFLGTDEQFARLDTDGDEIITQEEAEKAAPRR